MGALLSPAPATVVIFDVAYTAFRLGTWDFGPGMVYSHFDYKGKDAYYSYSQSMDVFGTEVFIMEQGGFFATLGAAMAWNTEINTYRSPDAKKDQAIVPVVNVGWAWTVWR